MTTYVHRCMVVSAAVVVSARLLAEQLAGPPGARMFITGLSASGNAPATHYISSGEIENTFATVLADPVVMAASCLQAGVSASLLQCQTILLASDVSSQQPFDAMARLGLKMIQDTL